MNINWMKIGCVSVAEYGRFTLVIRFRHTENETWLEIRETSSGTLKHSASTTRCEEKAISECELWLEQNDRPEWHDVTDWLSWAEWRGWRMCVRPDSADPSRTQWSASKNGYRGEFLSIAGPDFPGAKYAVEKWVREQGAKV